MAEEWGPWVEHDGKGCPLEKGTLGEACLRNGKIVVFRALCGSVIGGPNDPIAGCAWEWGNKPIRWRFYEVIRYRVRKPRALLDLIEMVESLPEQVDA